MSLQRIDTGVSPERPWLGLSSFTEDTQNYFFGREREIGELFDRIRNQPLTVLYGLSGRGKTSLLGAGLIPKLRQSGARPVLLRLRQDESTNFVDQLRRAWEQAVNSEPDGATLWERGYRKAGRPALQAAPPVLILDQFEEVFTLGQTRSAELEALFREIAGVVENRVPAELRERLAEDGDFAEQFDEQTSPARIVITLREDYLAHLETWKGVLPALMRNRIALLPLNGTDALKAVLQPGQMGTVPLVDELTASRIVRFVAQRGEETPLEDIEAVPPLLSLLCFELNKARLDAGAGQITSDQLEAQKANILHNFYLRCFDGLPEAVRDVVESPLVVSESGHRNTCTEEDLLLALESAGLSRPEAEAALARLVSSRLVTQERMAGVRRNELTHDLLTPLVVRSRNERRTQRQLAAAEAERAEVNARNALLQKERRRWKWAAVAMGFLAASAVVAGNLAWRAERRAAETLKIAQTTVDQVLTILESPEMDEVHGFFRVENALLDRLVPLERELNTIKSEDSSPAGVLRKVKLNLRTGERLVSEGRPLESAALYQSVYKTIAALPDAQITPELRNAQFQSLYRMDVMSYLFKRGEYDQKQWIETGTALFETTHTHAQLRYWREAFAQQIARYLRGQQQAERALVVLNRALADLRTAAGDIPNIWAIETEMVLRGELASTQEALNRPNDARETRRAATAYLDAQFRQRPRSILLAQQRLFSMFDQLDAAYWSKDANTHTRISVETENIISRFTGSKDIRFEAAAAQLQAKQAEFAYYVKADPRAAVRAARAALSAYGSIYAGQPKELSYFDSSGVVLNVLTGAMDTLESKTAETQRQALRKWHGKELLDLSTSYMDCAAKLGVRSTCQTIVEVATERAVDLLKDEAQILRDALPQRRSLIRDAAMAMVERDRQRPPSLPVSERESTEPLYRHCQLEGGYARSLLTLNRAAEAVTNLTEAITACEPWAKEYDFDFYLRSSFSGLLHLLAKAQQAVGDVAQARITLARCADYEFFQCYEPYAAMLDSGTGGSRDVAMAAELHARKLNMKRFTVPVRKKGDSKLTFPFHVYISELSDKRRYQGIEDQAIWLERNRGLIVPQEVRDSFIRLEEIARKNHVSFPDLAVYAMGTAAKDTKSQDKSNTSADPEKTR